MTKSSLSAYFNASWCKTRDPTALLAGTNITAEYAVTTLMLSITDD
jgi:hypothetical protein